MNKSNQQTADDLLHQIRNRLTYIMLSSHTLRCDLQEVLSEEQRTEFCQIDVAAEEIRSILDNLTRLVFTELAEPRLKREEVDLLIGG
jgi:hypothetical protein